MKKNVGKIIQIISAVIDVQFEDDATLPKILTSLFAEASSAS